MRGVTAIPKRLLDALLPPRCLCCDGVVSDAGGLCSGCFSGMNFISAPFCETCGMPFETTPLGPALCAACLQDPPAFQRGRAVFVYDDRSKGLALKLKHADRTDLACHLARWMHRAGADVVADCDVIVPVPLHRRRLLLRTYNQAALLANALGRLARKPVAVDTLVRLRPTPSQGGLDRAQRRRNVAGAFAVQHARLVAGRKVLLVDDVLTTGATVEACAAALSTAGARSVEVLVLARVPGPG